MLGDKWSLITLQHLPLCDEKSNEKKILKVKKELNKQQNGRQRNIISNESEREIMEKARHKG